MRRLRLTVKFEPRDLWLGVFVEKPDPFRRGMWTWRQRTFVTLVPMLPIVVTRERTWNSP